MKSVVFVFAFMICRMISSAQGAPPPVQEKSYPIHTTKRPFVKKENRIYLKNKVQPVQNQTNNNTQQNADYYIKLGLQKDSLNDYKKAVDNFNGALSIDPLNVEARYYLGVMMFQMEDYGNSLEDFNTASLSDTESVDLYYMKGNARFEMGLYKDAIDDYNKALRLDPTDKEIFYNRAIAKYKSGELLDACRDLESARRYGDSWAGKTQEEICK